MALHRKKLLEVFEELLEDTEKSAALFGFLSDRDNLAIISYLYSLKNGEFAGVDQVAHATGINRDKVKKALDELKAVETKARKITEERKLAYFYKDKVRPAMDALRDPADKLEMLVDKKDWPFPTYADLLFEG